MRDRNAFSYHLTPAGDSLKTFCIPVSIIAFGGLYHKRISLSNSCEIFLCKVLVIYSISAVQAEKDFQT